MQGIVRSRHRHNSMAAIVSANTTFMKISAIKSAMEKLGVESQALGQAIYDATQAEQPAGDGAGGSSSSRDDDVVDAEVVEDDEERK